MDDIYGDEAGKKTLSSDPMTSSDLVRLINSDKIQSVVNPAKLQGQKHRCKKNTAKSLKALAKLDQYMTVAREAEMRAYIARESKRSEVLGEEKGVGEG